MVGLDGRVVGLSVGTGYSRLRLALRLESFVQTKALAGRLGPVAVGSVNDWHSINCSQHVIHRAARADRGLKHAPTSHRHRGVP